MVKRCLLCNNKIKKNENYCWRHDDKPVKIRYELTDFGEKLVPLVENMISRGQENLTEGSKDQAWVT